MERIISQLTELVTCKICEVSKDLHVLSCLHRICNKCLNRLEKTVVYESGTLATRINCPFCRQPSTTRQGKGMQKCRISLELKEVIQMNQAKTTSTATQTVVNLTSNHTQTTGSSKRCVQTDKDSLSALAKHYSVRPKENQGKRSVVPSSCKADFKELAGLVAKLNGMCSSFLKPYSPQSCEILPLHTESNKLMQIKPEDGVKSRLRCKYFDDSFEYCRWLHTQVSDESAGWFIKPGVSANNTSQLTAIQALRAKSIHRVLPLDVYTRRWECRSPANCLSSSVCIYSQPSCIG